MTHPSRFQQGPRLCIDCRHVMEEPKPKTGWDRYCGRPRENSVVGGQTPRMTLCSVERGMTPSNSLSEQQDQCRGQFWLAKDPGDVAT